MDTKVYACYNRQENTRLLSSSGGVYALFAKMILRKNGIVYAVCYDEYFETVHREIESIDELELSYGSKYVPSKLNDTFLNVKKNLDNGRWVLFVGTPCQCGGLLSYVGKDNSKLLCIDFICHGVPSRSVWRRYLETLQQENKLIDLNMRDKSTGWSKYQYNWKIQYENGIIDVKKQESIPYMRGFVLNYYLRPSCYECRFKGVDRYTDITLGDFWGIWNICPEIDDNKGISVVIAHSKKGQDMLLEIKSEMKCVELDVENVIKYNPSIQNSAIMTRKRKKFFKELEAGKTFEHILDTLSKESWAERIEQKIKKLITFI